MIRSVEDRRRLNADIDEQTDRANVDTHDRSVDGPPTAYNMLAALVENDGT